MSESVAILLDKFPAYKGDQRMVTRRQDTFDIIREIIKKHRACVGDYDSIDPAKWWKGNAADTAANLYYYAKNNMPYKVEPTLQQTVKTPAAILKERYDFGNDCKHYASFIVGVAEALRRRGYPISSFYRFASYNDKRKSPGHVFAVIKDGDRDIWVDPVPEIGGFNRRTIHPVYMLDKTPPMSHRKYSIGDLYDISGIPIPTEQHVSGMYPDRLISGARRHWLDEGRNSSYDDPGLPGMGKGGKGKAKLKKLGTKLKKIAPGKILKKVAGAAPRNAYLALLKMNAFNKAVHIHEAIQKNPAAWTKLHDFWQKMGGDPNKLSTAINNGVSTHNKLHPKKKVSGFDDYNSMYGYEPSYDIGVVAVAGAAALIAAAAPIIKAISGLLKSIGVKNDDAAAAAETADDQAAADHNNATDEKGDGNADVKADGSVDHGNGVTTKVTTDSAGNQTVSYDVKEPSATPDDGGGAGDEDDSTTTKTKTVTKTKTKKGPGDGSGSVSDMLANVTAYVSDHKAGIGLTTVGAVGLIYSIGHKWPKKSKAPVIIGLVSAAAIVAGGMQLLKKSAE